MRRGYLTARETADYFGVTTQTLRLWRKRGLIEGTRLTPSAPFRFTREQITAFEKRAEQKSK